MKLLSPFLWKAWDENTIQNQSISSLQLMEKASLALKKTFLSTCQPKNEDKILIFCGVGNNGGDGLVLARLLHAEGFEVEVVIVEFSTNYSDDFTQQLTKLKFWNIPFSILSESNYKSFPFPQVAWVLDAIFGYGLQRDLSVWLQDLISKINQQNYRVVAIDVPSGMFLHRPSSTIVQSEIILTIEQPKTTFFTPSHYFFAQHWKVVPIGLDPLFLADSDSTDFLVDDAMAINLLQPTHPFVHKGSKGHVLVVGGAYGKIGAVYLSGKGAMHVGAGMLTAWVPKKGVPILQTNFPEMMVVEGKKNKIFKGEQLPISTNALLIGPGLGQHKETIKSLEALLPQIQVPVVFDADAINILANHRDLLSLLPPNTIFTPHPKEFERLIGTATDDWDMLEKIKAFSEKYQCIVVMKNARTRVVVKQKVYYFAMENPRLATAGSGDVLAGIITGLLAQGYGCEKAACLGVYLHAKSAAMSEKSVATFIASDILLGLDAVFQYLEKKKTEC